MQGQGQQIGELEVLIHSQRDGFQTQIQEKDLAISQHEEQFSKLEALLKSQKEDFEKQISELQKQNEGPSKLEQETQTSDLQESGDEELRITGKLHDLSLAMAKESLIEKTEEANHLSQLVGTLETQNSALHSAVKQLEETSAIRISKLESELLQKCLQLKTMEFEHTKLNKDMKKSFSTNNLNSW